MPRIAATLLCLALVVAALWWNIVSYPVVWQMLAPKDRQPPPTVAAVAVEQPKAQAGRNAVEQPKTDPPHVPTNPAEPEKRQFPVLALSTDASARLIAGSAPQLNEKPSDGAPGSSPSATELATENSERRYPPEPFLTEAGLPARAECKGGCCPTKREAAPAVGSDPSARQTGSTPLQWLPPDKQPAGSTGPSQQQPAQPATKPTGTSLPAVVAGFSRMAQEASGPVPIQPASHPGALVPVSRDSERTDSSAFQVRRLPAVEDEEQPTAMSSSVASEAPTTYPSTGIE